MASVPDIGEVLLTARLRDGSRVTLGSMRDGGFCVQRDGVVVGKWAEVEGATRAFLETCAGELEEGEG